MIEIITNSDLITKISKNTKVSLLQEPITSVKNNLASIGGMDDLIDEIIQIVNLSLHQPERFIKYNLSPPKGILLHGPPGFLILM